MNEEISVDELPLHSPWPQRILGLEEFQRKPRNSEENHREYETEKWKNALDEYLSHAERPDFTQFIRNELSKEKNHPVYWQKKLLIMRPEDSFGLQVELIAQAVEKYLPAPALVELGAGTGRVLFSLAKKFQSNAGRLIGAEFSENGRKLIKGIGLASGLSIEVLPCDFTKDRVVKKIP
ncbi:MAG: class I SAM-dependent methyltransferase, partial [Flavobacteriia bacterium]|nr:class I SAM-dependent methyltransferase [Flavobacteriia bacterium]